MSTQVRDALAGFLNPSSATNLHSQKKKAEQWTVHNDQIFIKIHKNACNLEFSWTETDLNKTKEDWMWFAIWGNSILLHSYNW